MSAPYDSELHPSKDPRQSINAFARLMARLASPFANRANELARSSMLEADLDALEARWVARIQADPSAIALYQAAYAAEATTFTDRHGPLGGAQEPTSLPDTAQRSKAASPRLGAVESDANETLPITKPVGEALPFQVGVYRPAPPLRCSPPAGNTSHDPDATRPPIVTGNAKGEPTLPFAKAPGTGPKPTDG